MSPCRRWPTSRCTCISATPSRRAAKQLDENELLEIERVPIRDLHQAILEGREPVVSMNYTVLFAAAQGRLPL